MSRRYTDSRVKQYIKHQWLHGREWLECHYCGERLTFAEITLDHIKPRSKRGGNFISNLLPACRCCNLKRGAKSYAEFVRSIAA